MLRRIPQTQRLHGLTFRVILANTKPTKKPSSSPTYAAPIPFKTSTSTHYILTREPMPGVEQKEPALCVYALFFSAELSIIFLSGLINKEKRRAPAFNTASLSSSSQYRSVRSKDRSPTPPSTCRQQTDVPSCF